MFIRKQEYSTDGDKRTGTPDYFRRNFTSFWKNDVKLTLPDHPLQKKGLASLEIGVPVLNCWLFICSYLY